MERVLEQVRGEQREEEPLREGGSPDRVAQGVEVVREARQEEADRPLAHGGDALHEQVGHDEVGEVGAPLRVEAGLVCALGG